VSAPDDFTKRMLAEFELLCDILPPLSAMRAVEALVRQDERERIEGRIYDVLAECVGGCREDMPDGSRCWAKAEYVLWGKLLPARALGPRCYDHAAEHIGHHGLASGSGWALLHLRDIARRIRREGLLNEISAIGQEQDAP